ncbi:MAG: transketolase [Desulfobacterales bacterium]|nr:transketolase [Desulfobacterales bacterium]
MADSKVAETLMERAKALRRHMIKMASNGQLVHIGGSLSIAEMMAALFFHFLDVEGRGKSKDHFILSKGHTVHAFHACLAELGKVDEGEFSKLGQTGTRLAGHPSLKAPLVEFATGSLGHGLSVGIGIALAEQLDGTDSRTVVMMGDGEIQEGSVWEAALCAPRFGLENLLAIVDCNKFQAAKAVDDVLPLDPLDEKWRSFCWNTEVIDGHDMGAILDVLEKFPAEKGPTVIIANTVKGKGAPVIEGTPESHYATLEEKDVNEALNRLEVI